MNHEKIDRTAATARIVAKQARIAYWQARAAWAVSKGYGYERFVDEALRSIDVVAAELDELAQAIEDETTTCRRCGWKCASCQCAEGPKR